MLSVCLLLSLSYLSCIFTGLLECVRSSVRIQYVWDCIAKSPYCYFVLLRTDCCVLATHIHRWWSGSVSTTAVACDQQSLYLYVRKISADTERAGCWMPQKEHNRGYTPRGSAGYMTRRSYERRTKYEGFLPDLWLMSSSLLGWADFISKDPSIMRARELYPFRT